MWKNKKKPKSCVVWFGGVLKGFFGASQGKRRAISLRMWKERAKSYVVWVLGAYLSLRGVGGGGGGGGGARKSFLGLCRAKTCNFAANAERKSQIERRLGFGVLGGGGGAPERLFWVFAGLALLEK